jgi:hypothetical protein
MAWSVFILRYLFCPFLSSTVASTLVAVQLKFAPLYKLSLIAFLFFWTPAATEAHPEGDRCHVAPSQCPLFLLFPVPPLRPGTPTKKLYVTTSTKGK